MKNRDAYDPDGPHHSFLPSPQSAATHSAAAFAKRLHQRPAIKPSVELLLSRKQHRHCLGVNWPHNIIGCSGQEREQAMLARFAFALAGP
jgi:hypothetical protein